MSIREGDRTTREEDGRKLLEAHGEFNKLVAASLRDHRVRLLPVSKGTCILKKADVNRLIEMTGVKTLGRGSPGRTKPVPPRSQPGP